MSSSSSSMSPLDLESCRGALVVWKSDRHKDKNYIFMQPVDVVVHSDYLGIVKKPMDLTTLTSNLENGVYKTRHEFFTDAKLIFQNAQLYNKGHKERAWIVKLARDMLKVVNREEKKADKKADEAVAAAKVAAAQKAAASQKAAAAPKIKFKMSSKASSTEQKPTKTPKISLKLGGNSSKAKATAPAAAAAPVVSSKPAPSKPAPTKPAAKPKPKKPKITLSMKNKPTSTKVKSEPPRGPVAPSRGKELPKGVVAPTSKPAPKPKPKSQPKKSKTTTTTTPSASTMTQEVRVSCFKVLAGIKRRQPEHCKWFLKPISDKQVIDDYRAKIPVPMDLGTMAQKLEKEDYRHVGEFVLDLRRVFGNCLRYNTAIQDQLRPVAIAMQETSEQVMSYFLHPQKYPKLLYCWRYCVSVLDALLNLTNATDGHQTAHYFLHPVSFYFGGHFPPDYLARVKVPMDLGTVTSKLMEGIYQSVRDFCNDCKLVVQNCILYYSGREQVFVEQAKRLQELMSQQLDALMRYDSSANGKRAAALYQTNVVKPPKPTKQFLLGVLEEMRSLTYTDKFTKLSEPATRMFEKPVDIVQNPDYLKVCKTPMDLQTVELRIKSESYETLEDFEYDVALVFKNCEAYHGPRRNDHMVSIAKFCGKNFRKILVNRLKAPPPPEAAAVAVKREAPPQQGPPSKKVRVEPPGGGKAVPRISITASAALAASKTLQRQSSSMNSSRAKSPQQPQKKKDDSSQKNQPVPLHVAIAQVKEKFPLRRHYKYLQPWEASCARFFRELMKHPWISAARPKFIFHVPVPVLFPDLQQVYTTKILKPMDLTTVEAKLLQGGLYRGPQDMVDDVGLVFSNAITFNREGRDAGDLLSCAYYDASVHLLKYTRWLSLELLTEYFGEDSPPEVPNEGEPTLTSWKLMESNKKAARVEQESIVLNEYMDKSFEGDRYTWMEAECEKLLKALRHMSDNKPMSFFLTANYPADYAAFISRPMDWDKVNKTLKRREYDTIGEVVADLRLIFANALKYNGFRKQTDKVSGVAYEAAIYMSGKLEAAIDKMMLTVAERLERERIEHQTAEREIEAADRAEEEKMRAQWTGSSGARPPELVETVETSVRIIKRPQKQREMRDFELPYFDEEDGGHEQSYIDYMRQQRDTFDKQRLQRSGMKATAAKTGASVFARLQQRGAALTWANSIAKEREAAAKSNAASSAAKPQAGSGSLALAELSRAGRAQIKIAVAKKKPKKTKKQPAPLSLE